MHSIYSSLFEDIHKRGEEEEENWSFSFIKHTRHDYCTGLQYKQETMFFCFYET